jgi:folate-dependent phosphoribosylglycinamide formyltransferase PurN
MRLVICAKNDLAANLAVNRLLRRLHGCSVTLWLSDIDRPAELDDPDLETLRFFERQLPKRWLWPLLEGAAADDRPRCRSFAELARDHRCELAIVDSLRRPAWQERLAALDPDLVISIRFSHIFPAALLPVPRYGVINLHPGDLPRYAGLFAPFHQILDGQERLGCTLHWVDAGIDTGPVIARRFMRVDPARSLLWHVCHVYPLGIDALVEVVDELRAGRRPAGEMQPAAGRRYHRLPDRADFARFQGAGWKLVDYADYEEILAAYQPQAAVEPRALQPAAR